MKQIINFNTEFFTDQTNGKNDVVVKANGKEIYREPRTQKTRIAGYNLYMSQRYGKTAIA